MLGGSNPKLQPVYMYAGKRYTVDVNLTQNTGIENDRGLALELKLADHLGLNEVSMNVNNPAVLYFM